MSEEDTVKGIFLKNIYNKTLSQGKMGIFGERGLYLHMYAYYTYSEYS